MDIHIFLHGNDDEFKRKLDQIISAISGLRSETMAKIDELRAAVADQTTVVQSAVTFMDNIAQQLKDAIASSVPTDQAVQEIIDSINANKKTLADDMVKNTPAAATEPPATEPPASETGTGDGTAPATAPDEGTGPGV